MRKPILIVRIPVSYTKDQIEGLKDVLKQILNEEYHVLAISTNISEEVQFECVGDGA